MEGGVEETMRTIKGPGIFLTQFAENLPGQSGIG